MKTAATYGLTAGLLLAGALPGQSRDTSGAVDFTPPMERFVTNRPRLFLNPATLGGVMRYAASNEAPLLAAFRTRLDALAANPNLPPDDYGMEAAAAAFLFLQDRTPDRLDLASRLLTLAVAHYRECDRQRRRVSWYAFSRIHAITAYDWLYDSMPPEARARLGRDILDHVEAAQPGHSPPPDANPCDYRSGFYGERALVWYTGIALRGTGIDEAKANRAIALGYADNMRLLHYRRRIAGDDGGCASPTLGYALQADPWAEFNFFHTMRSAFGLDIATNWPHVALLPNYAIWNHLPGGLEFGTGDASHRSNAFPDSHLYTHMAQIRHFYGATQPAMAALAAWVQDRTPRKSWFLGASPITPLLLTRLPLSPPPAPPANLPAARHFAGVGQIIMRSGWDNTATAALFTGGGCTDGIQAHKHFDENSFTLFHKGYLALDSGDRPEPGNHLSSYYCRTVAHNGILIRMKNETFPSYWGKPAAGEPREIVLNDGGMFTQTGAVIRAFRTTPDYTYIASDATVCYHPGKCRLAQRQFVHIQPNIFVVYDRVKTRQNDQSVTWLLHTQEEPLIQDNRFTTSHRGGRLWCTTVLPSKARLTKVGGPGREFWIATTNCPLPSANGKTAADPAQDLFGRWRMEVTPLRPTQDVDFLHVIETGDTSDPNPATTVKPRSGWNWRGVELRTGDRIVTVRFASRGEPGGKILFHTATRIYSDSLDNTVQPQAGLGP